MEAGFRGGGQGAGSLAHSLADSSAAAQSGAIRRQRSPQLTACTAQRAAEACDVDGPNGLGLTAPVCLASGVFGQPPGSGTRRASRESSPARGQVANSDGNNPVSTSLSSSSCTS